MTEPLAEIRTYQEFIAALRQRMAAVAATGEIIDHVGGLPAGYTRKLLAPIPIRVISRVSFSALLGALGCKLLLVQDDEAWLKISPRITRSRFNRWDAGGKMPAKPKRINKGDSAWGTFMRQRQVLLQSPKRRRDVARKAAKARWRKPKVVEIKIDNRA